MTASSGYGRVPEVSFQGFSRYLGEGAWSEIPTPAPGVDRLALPARELFKLWLVEAVEAMNQAFVATDADGQRGLDRDWDLKQRRLATALELLEMDPDAAQAAAAARLRALALRGSGLEQTRYRLAQEVSFGTMQRSLLDPKVNPQAAADIGLLKLEPYFEAIGAATDRLDAALRSGSGAAGARLRQARALCVDRFETVRRALGAELAAAEPGPGREAVEALLQPLTRLLEERSTPHPASPGSTVAEAPEAAQG